MLWKEVKGLCFSQRWCCVWSICRSVPYQKCVCKNFPLCINLLLYISRHTDCASEVSIIKLWLHVWNFCAHQGSLGVFFNYCIGTTITREFFFLFFSLLFKNTSCSIQICDTNKTGPFLFKFFLLKFFVLKMCLKQFSGSWLDISHFFSYLHLTCNYRK